MRPVTGRHDVSVPGKEQATTAFTTRGEEIVDRIGAVTLETQPRHGKADSLKLAG